MAGPTAASAGSEDALPIFFIESPDGLIDSIAGADSIEPPPTNPRLSCHHCQTLLEFTAGASYVQCFVCRTMNAVLSGSQLGGRTMNMLCTVCGTSNLAPWGTAYVRCGQCNTVSDVTHVYTAGAGRWPPLRSYDGGL
eukprot:gnl/TRDRNA2_/TRDRNA2_165421_c0_seq1.p2 gnl/TRDRNA2_/TRDRNA2_165421_c0~~gnl/TRDRNA2_/TRDRNA2_165421_c0_seq1.p2  ORF type:complete len:138 (+),score=11.89 gnl/TRDRNA2_/TRDRNA2_165421_c0_seq1:73-486(+)